MEGSVDHLGGAVITIGEASQPLSSIGKYASLGGLVFFMIIGNIDYNFQAF